MLLCEVYRLYEYRVFVTSPSSKNEGTPWRSFSLIEDNFLKEADYHVMKKNYSNKDDILPLILFWNTKFH